MILHEYASIGSGITPFWQVLMATIISVRN
jgi:hypothetical protein